jgi:hypothetical protein
MLSLAMLKSSVCKLFFLVSRLSHANNQTDPLMYNTMAFQSEDSEQLSETFDPDPSVMYFQVGCEVFNTAFLVTGSYLFYYGIEISHPVYAVLFCNLITAMLTSVINTFVTPLLGNALYTRITNSINVACLYFHCCCWCIVSVLRYNYIINQEWLEQNWPNNKLKMFSLIAVFVLFFSGQSIMLSTAFLLGFPQIRFIQFSSYAKTICLTVYCGAYIVQIFASCYCYILILRKRGKLGHSTVGVEERNPVSFTDASAQFMASGDVRINPLIIEQEALKQCRKEIDSAITSLKTNLIISLCLALVALFMMVFSSEVLLVLFSLLKGQSPVWTTFFNFQKVQNLVILTFEEVKATLTEKGLVKILKCK